MASFKTCLLLAGGASVALAAPGGGLRLGARAFSNTTESCPYTVEIDDNCYFIAKNRFDVSVADLSKLNAGKFDATCDIFPDQEVRVPCRAQQPVDQVDVSGKCLVEHKVEAGETCASISLKYNIAAHVLQTYNKLDRKCSLQAEQTICVSTKKSPAACARQHTVVAGDSCYDLASKNGANLLDLKTWNPDLINDRCAIRPGHKVCVAADAAEPVTTSASAVASPVASPTTVRISSVASAGPVVPTAAVPAAVANLTLSSEARVEITRRFQSFVGNRTVAVPDAGDDKVLLPSQPQLGIALKALASVSIHEGKVAASTDANAAASAVAAVVAPGVSVSASASVLVRILAAAKLNVNQSGCSVGACTVVVTAPSHVAANVAANANANANANAVVSSQGAGSKGDAAANAAAVPQVAPQVVNRISASAVASANVDSC